ncbi:MAG: MoaD/ThiS family protein, partial [Candidatus Rokubacteria bacterium]|nr:MoaD/ThiS family protein [Candidatus Rokubacteria bacterium]
IYVNSEAIEDLQGLATPLKDGDEVTIIPALAGGLFEPRADGPAAGRPVTRRGPSRFSSRGAADEPQAWQFEPRRFGAGSFIAGASDEARPE